MAARKTWPRWEFCVRRNQSLKTGTSFQTECLKMLPLTSKHHPDHYYLQPSSPQARAQALLHPWHHCHHPDHWQKKTKRTRSKDEVCPHPEWLQSGLRTFRSFTFHWANLRQPWMLMLSSWRPRLSSASWMGERHTKNKWGRLQRYSAVFSL